MWTGFKLKLVGNMTLHNAYFHPQLTEQWHSCGQFQSSPKYQVSKLPHTLEMNQLGLQHVLFPPHYKTIRRVKDCFVITLWIRTNLNGKVHKDKLSQHRCIQLFPLTLTISISCNLERSWRFSFSSSCSLSQRPLAPASCSSSMDFVSSRVTLSSLSSCAQKRDEREKWRDGQKEKIKRDREGDDSRLRVRGLSVTAQGLSGHLRLYIWEIKAAGALSMQLYNSHLTKKPTLLIFSR